MVFNSAQLNFNIILLFLLGIYDRVEINMAHHCFVCGGAETNLSCDKFDSHNKSFIQECPSADTSCFIEKDGNSYTRSCSALSKIEDCKTINHVKYCYCSQDLCNKDINMYNSDDEDFPEEGSGTSVIIDTNQNEPKKISNTSQSSHIHLSSYSIYMPLLTILCY